jgi:hypothetical protein
MESLLPHGHAFISYVRENADLVDRLVNELRNNGLTIWLDREAINPGERWKDTIKKAIKNGEFFIACFSKESNERDKTYMREEITVAIDELRVRPTDKSWFIPVILNECSIPSRRISELEDINDIHSVRLCDNWDDSVRRIVRMMKKGDP